MVKKLVEMHGGQHHRPRARGSGQGSEFTVRLPAAEQARRARTRPTADRAGRQRRRSRRILVVDDNVDTARGMARLLKLLGHEVATAHGGPEAIEAARSIGRSSSSSTSAFRA